MELGDIFAAVGSVVPHVGVKFRLAGKYTSEGLEGILSQLVDKEILTKFEFNNNVSFKCKDDIPLSIATKATASANGTGSSNGFVDAQRIKDLETMVLPLETLCKTYLPRI